MANYLIFDGDSYVAAPTLGDLTTPSSFRIVSENVKWESLTGYLWSQASSGTREFGLWRSNGDLQLYLLGSNYTLMTSAEVTTEFGSTTVSGQIEILVETANNVQYDVTLKHGGTTIATLTSVSPALTRVDGELLRFGARSASATGGTADGAYYIGSTDTIGDTTIYIDGVLERTYTMPSTGTTITDSTNAQNATVYNSAGDDSEWGSIAATPGISSKTLQRAGVAVLAATADVMVFAGTSLTGTPEYAQTGLTLTVGVLADIDLSATALAVDDDIVVVALPATGGPGIVLKTTVEGI